MPQASADPAKMIDQLKINVSKADVIGSLISNDLKSSVILVPLLDRYADTGKPIDYAEFSQFLEQDIRARYEVPGIRIHVIGFAKLVGDLIHGLRQVMLFFGLSALIATVIIYLYTRCVRSTFILVVSAMLGVVWLLGVLQLLGYELDPYSILVPFLIFAIGLSHGAQKMNGIMQDVGRGTHKYVAARYTFRRLFMAGLTALLTNVVGFAVLMIIDVPVIKDLALTTSIGVCILIFTKLLLVPVLLSYVGVSPRAARRSLQEASTEAHGRGLGRVWLWLELFTTRHWATGALVVAALLGVGGFVVSGRLQIGDLDPGAPELRPTSRYNLDNAYISSHYGLSTDLFVTMVTLPRDGCFDYQNLVAVDRLEARLRELDGVQTTRSIVGAAKIFNAGANEGYPKWLTIARDPRALSSAVYNVQMAQPDIAQRDCTFLPVIAYLKDHKAATLNQVLATVDRFASENNPGSATRFLPAAGSAGIEAITNIVVKQANRTMLVLVYAVVALLCFVTFRSWRAVIVALVPLVLTSILCEALMVMLGIGVKVATLPVIALGVGVGVDYALYLLSVQLALQRSGVPLRTAYQRALMFTGRVVALVGITLAAGVITWAWSPIKFQADMGILLTFMFLWNMVGALTLIPALSHFLLRSKESLPATHRVEASNVA
jgi:predicted RND superfamily exporter protein